MSTWFTTRPFLTLLIGLTTGLLIGIGTPVTTSRPRPAAPQMPETLLHATASHVGLSDRRSAVLRHQSAVGRYWCRVSSQHHRRPGSCSRKETELRDGDGASQHCERGWLGYTSALCCLRGRREHREIRRVLTGVESGHVSGKRASARRFHASGNRHGEKRAHPTVSGIAIASVEVPRDCVYGLGAGRKYWSIK